MKVSEGDLIAISGQGSPNFGPGLYLELRHFSDAVDPLPWLKMAPELRASVQ
jgi:septal ring factor EnvC (AmiA/AmiB activator)